MSLLSFDDVKLCKDHLIGELEKIFQGKNTYPTYYCGGSLCINIGDNIIVMSLKDENLPEDIRLIVCLLYTKYKTKSHCYYDYCLKIIGDNLLPLFNDESLMY